MPSAEIELDRGQQAGRSILFGKMGIKNAKPQAQKCEYSGIQKFRLTCDDWNNALGIARAILKS